MVLSLSGGVALFRFFQDEGGSTTIIAAFGMVAIMAFLALAVDAGQLRYQRRNFQRAADAAALAATLEVTYCAGTPACTNMQTAAKSAMVENGLTPDNVVTNCGTAPSTGLTLMVNNGPCAQGANDPHNGSLTSVEVVLQQSQAGLFSGALGLGGTMLGARAEATNTGGSNCIFALDPTGSASFNVNTLAAVTSPCGIMVESSSSSALSCFLLGAITASQINVVGGVSNFLCAIAPTPKTNQSVPKPADPLAYLPLPSVPSCGTSTSSPYHGAASAVTVGFGQSVTFNADYAYCGGITIASGGTAVFNSGTYVLTSTNGGATRNPGGLTINLGTNVTGTGVTFYNYGPGGSITFNAPSLSLAGVQLVAPTSGTYAGILFFQPSNNTNGATLYGSTVYNTILEGAYYFPKAKVTFCFSGPVNYNILVAYDIVFQVLTFGFTSVTSSFGNNYGSLANGSPLAGSGATLSQ
jgi:Flp pilus assembly protein TadG